MVTAQTCLGAAHHRERTPAFPFASPCSEQASLDAQRQQLVAAAAEQLQRVERQHSEQVVAMEAEWRQRLQDATIAAASAAQAARNAAVVQAVTEAVARTTDSVTATVSATLHAQRDEQERAAVASLQARHDAHLEQLQEHWRVQRDAQEAAAVNAAVTACQLQLQQANDAAMAAAKSAFQVTATAPCTRSCACVPRLSPAG